MIHRVIPPLPREAKPRDPLVSSGTPHVLLSGSSALSLSGFSGPPSPQTLAETWWTQSNDMKACEYVTEVSLGVVFFGLVVVLPCAYVCLLVYRYIMIYMYIYICRWLIKIPLTANGQSSRIKTLLSRNFRQLHVCFSRGPCWATTPLMKLMKIRSPPAKLCQRITEFLIAFLNMQLASRNLFSGQICWLVFFLQGLLTHPLKHAHWLSPTPSRNFRENIPIHRPRPSAHQGPWCLALAKPHFWNLPAAFGACFLRLQKSWLGSDSGRCKDVLQDHGVWLSRSLTFGSSAATYEGQSDCPKAPPHRELNQNQTEILRCPSPAGPQAAMGGRPSHNDSNIQLSGKFRKKKTSYFRELENKLSQGFPT